MKKTVSKVHSLTLGIGLAFVVGAGVGLALGYYMPDSGAANARKRCPGNQVVIGGTCYERTPGNLAQAQCEFAGYPAGYCQTIIDECEKEVAPSQLVQCMWDDIHNDDPIYNDGAPAAVDGVVPETK